MVTVNFRFANMAFENGLEIEYNPENGIYQFSFLSLTKNVGWKVSEEVEIGQADVRKLIEYLLIMSKL
jgi:hypothetical protein